MKTGDICSTELRLTKHSGLNRASVLSCRKRVTVLDSRTLTGCLHNRTPVISLAYGYILVANFTFPDVTPWNRADAVVLTLRNRSQLLSWKPSTKNDMAAPATLLAISPNVTSAVT